MQAEKHYEGKSSHKLFWKTYARPFGKIFLLASITYLGLHFLWWHLYSHEKKREKKESLFRLEKTLHELYVFTSFTQTKEIYIKNEGFEINRMKNKYELYRALYIVTCMSRIIVLHTRWRGDFYNI
ncbi:hypothetical protein MERGE_002580 [Pneumocystis wakefieldiae]|uniref:Uncharacterized protein n=1 Tax=Pneumocystis wakefieldiae TaxID=38082 RepID=A0A899FU13_9ASCO|nr:hypothetical protein MERGE_002580 [Pneumocystis wakefieldiae]